MSSSPVPMLRRFPSTPGFTFSFEGSKVLSGAFYPSSSDSDGLSVFAMSDAEGEDGRATPRLLLAKGGDRVKAHGGITSVTDCEIECIDLLGKKLGEHVITESCPLKLTPDDYEGVPFKDHKIIKQITYTEITAKGLRKQKIKAYTEMLAEAPSLTIHVTPTQIPESG